MGESTKERKEGKERKKEHKEGKERKKERKHEKEEKSGKDRKKEHHSKDGKKDKKSSKRDKTNMENPSVENVDAPVATDPTPNSQAEESRPKETVHAIEESLALALSQLSLVHPPLPLQFSDFRVIRTVGTGSFSRVVLVQHNSNGEYYAVKICKKAHMVKLKQVDHASNERAILMSSRHPYIVNLICTFKDEANIYFVFEYVAGGELFSKIRLRGRLSVDQARFYAAEIVLAIGFMHSKNIIYRDLKPENLLLDKDGHIKITDFGFAKVVADRTYTLCGTPDYLAPEIIQSKGYGKSVDWWALGILIYEMLVGFPPFADQSPFLVYEKILDHHIEFPSHLDNTSKDIIRKLLNKDKTQRLGSGRNGMVDVMNHEWFNSIDWELLEKRAIPGFEPPRLASPHDARYFARYPESEFEVATVDLFPDLFAEF